MLNIFQNFLFWLISIDKKIFLLINKSTANSVCDGIMPLMRNSQTWIPLYILIIIFAAIKLKHKIWWWLLFAVATVLITDQVSSHIFKPFFARSRPCSDLNFLQQVRLLLPHCSSGYSFTSSHACNHFGIAFFIAATLKSYLGKWKFLFFVWATIIAYAQVYVGVHYPIDVLCGAILGCLLAKATVHFHKKMVVN